MNLRYTETLKRTDVFNKIIVDVKAKRLRHCYVVLSADSVALEELANLLAAAVFCQTSQACLECAGCRSALSGANPDALFFEGPLKAEEAVRIAVGSLEKPYGGGHKVYVLTDFDKASEEAQNKLLKTLEEPSSDSVFFLFASSAAGVLPTVLSRAEVLECAPADGAVLKTDLERNFPTASHSDIEAAVNVSGGNIQDAQRFLSDRMYRGVVDFAYKILTRLKKSPQVAEFAEEAQAYRGVLKELLSALALAVRDVMAYKNAGEDGVLNKSRLGDIISIEEEFSTEACVKIIDRLNKISEGIVYNVNYIPIIDQTLFSYLEVKALCRR